MLKRQELFWGSGSKELVFCMGQHVCYWSSYYRIHNKYKFAARLLVEKHLSGKLWLGNFKISFHFTLDHDITNCHLLGRSDLTLLMASRQRLSRMQCPRALHHVDCKGPGSKTFKSLQVSLHKWLPNLFFWVGGGLCKVNLKQAPTFL